MRAPTVEHSARADVEHAGRVDPVLGMPVWHQLGPAGHLHANHVRSGLWPYSREHG
jgi:hypothetical protein